MSHRVAKLSTFGLVALLLTGCAASTTTSAESSGSNETTTTTTPTPEKPLDLTGNWKQENPNSPDSYQTASITADTLTVSWFIDGGDTQALYWAGSYVAPTEATNSYTWDSTNYTAQTDKSLMASTAATKTFEYNDGVISYEVSALGMTTTVKLARE